MQDQHNLISSMYMDSSLPSSTFFLQNIALNHMIDSGLPLIDNCLNVSDDIIKSSYFNVPQSLSRVGIIHGNGIFGGNVGVDRGDMFVPPLENVGNIEGNVKVENSEIRAPNNSQNSNNLGSHLLSTSKVGTIEGHGNYWEGDDLRVGEWDLEELMRDVSFLPCLDFQVE